MSNGQQGLKKALIKQLEGGYLVKVSGKQIVFKGWNEVVAYVSAYFGEGREGGKQ